MKISRPPKWLVWLLENSSATTDAAGLSGNQLLWTIAKAPFAFCWTALLCACVTPLIAGEYLFSKKR